MKLLKFIFLLLIIINFSNLKAEVPYILNFNFVLNESVAGKKAQDFLKKKLENGLKKLKEKESKIQEEEKKIIQQKKLITPEEYKKKVTELRNKVSSLQKERNSLLESISENRKKARNELLKNLNPILKEYMKEKNIRMVLDKKSILLSDEKLDITQDIIKRLNEKLKSIKLN